MGDENFQVPEKKRKDFIKKKIFKHLPKPKELLKIKKTEITDMINNYVGADSNALSVLAYAAEQGKLEEYIRRLKENYKENLQYVHLEERRIAKVPGVLRTEYFFLNCYKKLGIQPQAPQ